MRKHVEARKRREEVYLTFTEMVLAQGNGVIPKMTKTILEDVFIFLGGKKKDLNNQNKPGILEGVMKLSQIVHSITTWEVQMPPHEPIEELLASVEGNDGDEENYSM